MFRPGVSGNPSGRPKAVAEIRALAREHTKAALEALVEIVNNKKAPPAARVAAANSLLDRGYGRPETKIDASLEPSTATQSVFSAMLQLFDQAGFQVGISF